jgi:cytochrome c biogenesis protein CcmG, thiol:disulfide interchange protein DsbE
VTGTTTAPSRPRSRSAIIAGVVAVAVAALVALFAFSPKGETDDQDRGSPLEGKVAPGLTGTTIDGRSFDLDSYRGQWVLVNFFATWCPPCVAEHPELVALSQNATTPVQVVSVAFQDQTANVVDFFAENGGSWPVLVSDTGQAALEYGVVKLPESYLVDPDGRVVKKLISGITAAEVADIVSAEGGS